MPEISTRELMFAIKDSFRMDTYEDNHENESSFIYMSNNIDDILDRSIELCSVY